MTIYIVSHKSIIPPSDKGYELLQVGFAPDFETKCLRDNTLKNISSKNKFFCELTAIFWIWKNINADKIGLVHYRRFFSNKRSGGEIIDSKEIDKLIVNDNDIVLPLKRNYYICNIKEHYSSSHNIDDLNMLGEIIKSKHPDYYQSYIKVIGGRSLYLYNMFYANKSLMDEYFEWLFLVLSSLEREINYKSYDNYQCRVFGFLSERIFNIWLHRNKNRLNIIELPIYNLDGEPKIKKALSLFLRYISRKKNKGMSYQ